MFNTTGFSKFYISYHAVKLIFKINLKCINYLMLEVAYK